MARKSFSIRSFVSLLMAFCFAGLALSGVILYFAPPCSIAESTGWTVLAVSKAQWASLHQVSALSILFLAVLHLFVYNWKTFICHIKRRRLHQVKAEDTKAGASWSTRIKAYKEVIASVLVAIIVYVGALTLIAPFGWLHEGSDAIRDSYRQEAAVGTGRGLGTHGHDRIESGARENRGQERDQESIENRDEGRQEQEDRGEGGEGDGREESEGRGEGGRGEGRGDPEGRGEGGRGGGGSGQGRGDLESQGGRKVN